MSGQRPHDSAIAVAANAALSPLGFRRKGQSRIWLADHGYWLRVVEFQPSGWSKGSYLNVAAHWLWSPPADNPRFVLSFDYGGRVGDFVPLETEAHFAELDGLAARAAAEAEQLRDTFGSLPAIADRLIGQEADLLREGRGGHWNAYHAGVAAALAGRGAEAVELLDTVLAKDVPAGWTLHPAARAVRDLLGQPTRLRTDMHSLIDEQRTYFKLPALPSAPF